MHALILRSTGLLKDNPTALEFTEWPDPIPADDQLLIRVSVCGVCHTELDEIEGRMQLPHLPIILGHQAIGKIAGLGNKVRDFRVGDRVGVAWINSACGKCAYCLSGEENLCAFFRATGRDVHGGYAELMTVPAAFAYKIPEVFSDAEAAPLLCAGAIGFRSLRLTNLKDGQNLGLTGFGASAHLVLKLARNQYPASKVYVFARNKKERDFARELGAAWTGDTTDCAPQKLHAIIDTTPAWTPVVLAMENLAPGGRLVINAIRKEDADKEMLLKLNYPTHLWLEKEIKSVANVTSFDVSEFLRIAAEIHLKPEVQEYDLKDANRALLEMKERHVRGAKVLRISSLSLIR